jgi:tetratricopeptide (TPR) repeat protein
MGLADLFRSTPAWEKQIQQGAALLQRNRHADAVAILEQAAATAERARQVEGAGRAWALAGMSYQQLGQFDQAANAYVEALRSLHDRLDDQAAANLLNDLGICLRRSGQPAKAVEALTMAVQTNNGGDRSLEQMIYANMGAAWNDQDAPERAGPCLERALTLAQALGDRRAEALVYGNLGVMARKRGDNEAAYTYYHRNYTIARELGDRRSEATAISNLGNVYAARGQIDQAQACYQERIAIAAAIGDTTDVAMTHFNLAQLLQRAGRYDEALASARQAERLFTASGQAQLVRQTQTLIAHLRTGGLTGR